MTEETEDIIEEQVTEEKRSSWSPGLIAGVAVAGLFAIIVIASLGWYFFASGDSGQRVATPKDTSFGGSGDETSSVLGSDRESVD